ncbi:MAG TPA: toll/interleukin-1 receptor domain-containing protein [Planctomycetota bacterium]|nr:toll/interleukin-1 receptor domain-containing protein [Planctomycetota bacterium]
MAGIFICYRHSDTQHEAWRIRQALSHVFGRESVFMDVSDMLPGQNVRMVPLNVVSSARVVLILIGTKWLEERDTAGRLRLEDPDDPVRKEVETALAAHGVTIMPVYFYPAKKLRPEDLPTSIQALADMWGFTIHPFEDTEPDTERLVEVLTLHVEPRSTRIRGAKEDLDLKNVIVDRRISAKLLSGKNPSFLECVQATHARYLSDTEKSSSFIGAFHYNHFFGPSALLFISAPAAREPVMLWYPRILAAAAAGEPLMLWYPRILKPGEPGSPDRAGWSLLIHGSFKFRVVREECPMDAWVEVALRNQQRATEEFLRVPCGTLLKLLEYKVRLTELPGSCSPFAVITRDLRRSESCVFTQYVFKTTISIDTATTEEELDNAIASFQPRGGAPFSVLPQDLEPDFFVPPGESGKVMDYLALRGLRGKEDTITVGNDHFKRSFSLL